MAEPPARTATAATERTRNRNTELGDRACFCESCGWSRRFYPGVVEPPESCPHCEARVVSSCPSCGLDILSVMAIECDECGSQLRAPAVGDVRIRRPKRLPLAQVEQACGCDTDRS
jgi:hypothetical protein